MKKRCWILIVALLSLGSPSLAGELTVALGVFTLAKNGADFEVSYRPEQSSWQYGYRHVQWTDTFHDPYTGRAHSDTSEKLSGPVVNYLFWSDSRHTPYAGIALLAWTRTETPLLIAAPSNTRTTTDLYFGGGYTGRLGQVGYYNAGMYLSPTPKMQTQTTISSSDQSGNFDIQLQIGLTW